MICLETNECNRCRYNSNKNEGCDSSSTKPICDMDEATAGYQTSATRKLAKCEPCKKSGTCFYVGINSPINLVDYFKYI